MFTCKTQQIQSTLSTANTRKFEDKLWTSYAGTSPYSFNRHFVSSFFDTDCRPKQFSSYQTPQRVSPTPDIWVESCGWWYQVEGAGAVLTLMGRSHSGCFFLNSSSARTQTRKLSASTNETQLMRRKMSPMQSSRIDTKPWNTQTRVRWAVIQYAFVIKLLEMESIYIRKTFLLFSDFHSWLYVNCRLMALQIEGDCITHCCCPP